MSVRVSPLQLSWYPEKYSHFGGILFSPPILSNTKVQKYDEVLRVVLL